MFDISFGELVVIAAVALVILGPERLPKVAKTAGLLLGRVQRYVAGVKAELRQEMAREEFKAIEKEFRDTQESLQQSFQQTEQTLWQTADEAKSALSPTPAPEHTPPSSSPPSENDRR